MLKSAVSMAMWAGRTTAAFMGLAIVLALVFGVAAAALAAVPGDPFRLGQKNTINALTQLVGNRGGPMLTIDNDSTDDTAHALNLQVDRGNPPIRVNASSGTATGLSADRLDGIDSSRLARERAAVFGSEANLVSTVGYFEEFAFYNESFVNVVIPPAEGPPIAVQIDCTNETTAGALRLLNTGEFGDSVDVWVDNGSANPNFESLFAGETFDSSVAAAGDHFTVRVKSVFDTGEAATMEVFTKHKLNGCEVVAHAMYTTAS